VSNQTLLDILGLNISTDNSLNVNVVATEIKKIDNDLNLVKIVVGTPDPQDPLNIPQNKRFVSILQSLKPLFYKWL